SSCRGSISETFARRLAGVIENAQDIPLTKWPLDRHVPDLGRLPHEQVHGIRHVRGRRADSFQEFNAVYGILLVKGLFQEERASRDGVKVRTDLCLAIVVPAARFIDWLGLIHMEAVAVIPKHAAIVEESDRGAQQGFGKP